MGYERLEWVYGPANEDLSLSQKAVLGYLAFRQNGKTGQAAHPSVGAIARSVGLSERGARQALRELVDLGRIRRELNGHRDAPPGKQPNLYWANWTPAVVSPHPGSSCTSRGQELHPRGAAVAPKQEDEQEDEHHPPVVPQGGRRRRKRTSPDEGDPLFKEWNQVAEVGKRNECLETARIFETTKEKLRAVRRVAGHLEARGASWAELMAGFEAYEQEARLTPKNCSVEKLAANESVVELLLKAGANGVRKHVPIEEDPAYAPRG